MWWDMGLKEFTLHQDGLLTPDLKCIFGQTVQTGLGVARVGEKREHSVKIVRTSP